MLNLKIKHSVAVFILALTLAPTLAAERRSPTKRLSEIADQAAPSLGNMQACGQAFGTPYSDLADRLESNLQELIEVLGYDVDVFWRTYSKKVGVFSMMTKGDYSIQFSSEMDSPKLVEMRRDSDKFRSACKTMHFLAQSTEDTLRDALARARAKSAHAKG